LHGRLVIKLGVPPHVACLSDHMVDPVLRLLRESRRADDTFYLGLTL
jgi:hypothetical protein